MSEVVATMSPMPNNSFTSLTKFFKTPKGLLVIALAVLIPLAGAPSGFAVVAPGVAAAAIAAMLLRLHHWKKRTEGRSCVNARFAAPITAITSSPIATVSQDPST